MKQKTEQLTDTPGADWIETTLAEMRHHRPQIEEALRVGPGITHTFDSLVIGVLYGQWRLWSTPNGGLLTFVTEYPEAKHMHIFMAWGDMEELVALHEPVINNAREQGCSKLTISGRKGWVRALRDHGWTPTLVTLHKEI